MTQINRAWEDFKEASNPVPDELEMSEASYYAGALAMLLIMSSGGDVNAALQEIEGFGIDCPTFKRH